VHVIQLQVLTIYEPTVIATIISPQQHCGAVMKLAAARRGTQLEYNFLGGGSSSRRSSDGSSGSNGSNGGSSGVVAAPQEEASVLEAAAAVAEGGDGRSSSGGSNGSSGSGVFGGSMGDRVLLRYQLPLSELAGDFYSRLKSATQG
jgi:hypothetical protein